jgi:hypothetical protein
VFTELLSSNDRRDTNTDTTIELGSGATINIPSFINICSGITSIRRDIQTHRQQGDFTSLFLFFKNKENRLKFVNEDFSTSPFVQG